jgi:CBS domain containing-hemolysin-like protein
MVAPEDVFMADYANFKDEEDDSAASSLFSEGNDTVIVAVA